MTFPQTFDCTAKWDDTDLDAAVDLVAHGKLLVLPTDTVYGIGCDATNAEAVATLLAAKGRGRQMPPPVLVATPTDMDALCVDISEAARRLANEFWPGGLTLILKARPGLGWDLGETGGTLALRMPDQLHTLALLRRTGPMAVTSANTTGAEPATNIAQAHTYFGTTVAAYIDGGPTAGGTASTIIDLAQGQIRPIRIGTISLEQITRVANRPAQH